MSTTYQSIRECKRGAILALRLQAAGLAISASDVVAALVTLRDKAKAMKESSPNGTIGFLATVYGENGLGIDPVVLNQIVPTLMQDCSTRGGVIEATGGVMELFSLYVPDLSVPFPVAVGQALAGLYAQQQVDERKAAQQAVEDADTNVLEDDEDEDAA